jgi:hypothetical protein
MQLCATIPFARKLCVFSTSISYTGLIPIGLISITLRFIVGNPILVLLTPYSISSLFSSKNQSNVPISLKYSSAVGNDFDVNLPNSVPLIKWSVIS